MDIFVVVAAAAVAMRHTHVGLYAVCMTKQNAKAI